MNISQTGCTLVFLAVFTSMLPAQQGQSPMPELPPDIPKSATIWLQLVDKTPSGQDAVWTTPDGMVYEGAGCGHDPSRQARVERCNRCMRALPV